MTSTPKPALVPRRAAPRLPRLVLLLFCAAYVLPGLFGREPWKNADITAFGYMANIARGASPWSEPAIAGLGADGALLPYWLGAAFIKGLPWVEPALAARVPFALLLAAVLALVWYATLHLARTEAAQPVAFAFGGEADAVDYARAIADGALLALIASLGLLQLGHETTPELAQLTATALFVYALAASPYRPSKARIAMLTALPALTASGAPAIAVGIGAVGALVCARSRYETVRRFTAWVVTSTVLAVALAFVLRVWAWRIAPPLTADALWSTGRLFVWFTWPAWPLVLWTLWRWRTHLTHRHISVPLGTALVAALACVAMGGSDRALMLALPSLAVLAAFALPTLQRSVSAAIDWFSLFFFSLSALVIWVIYAAIQTGTPAKPASNVARLAPGFVAGFSWIEFAFAVAGTIAWLWLVRWRTARHREALWKSMVLPAAGVALSWLLLMTLWLPLLDYARSYRPLLERLAAHVPRDACIAAPGLPRSQLAALEVMGGWRVDAVTPHTDTPCEFLMTLGRPGGEPPVVAGWTHVARERRPTDRDEATLVYRRGSTAGSR